MAIASSSNWMMSELVNSCPRGRLPSRPHGGSPSTGIRDFSDLARRTATLLAASRLKGGRAAARRSGQLPGLGSVPCFRGSSTACVFERVVKRPAPVGGVRVGAARVPPSLHRLQHCAAGTCPNSRRAGGLGRRVGSGAGSPAQQHRDDLLALGCGEGPGVGEGLFQVPGRAGVPEVPAGVFVGSRGYRACARTARRSGTAAG